jgi:hypothetical protein
VTAGGGAIILGHCPAAGRRGNSAEAGQAVDTYDSEEHPEQECRLARMMPSFDLSECENERKAIGPRIFPTFATNE